MSASRPPIDPRRWTPPRSTGLRGPFARNEVLGGLQRIDVPGTGPEDIAVDGDGRVITGTDNGQILRISADGTVIERIATTGGRPLGIEVDADGTYVVCDADRGLLRVSPDNGEITALVTHWQGRPLRFTNNCDIAADGTIYFSESSDKFSLHHFKADVLEHASRGRLLRRTPDGNVELVLDGLDFANGVALAPDDSFVLVAETGGYRIRKVWLSGDRAGRDEVIIDNLPGMPDNMSTGDGVFWVAFPTERNALLDRLLPRPGFLRKAVWALPDALQPDVSRIAFVAGIDGNGTVTHNLQGHGVDFHYVTGVREHQGTLYLGSLAEPAIARISL